MFNSYVPFYFYLLCAIIRSGGSDPTKERGEESKWLGTTTCFRCNSWTNIR